MDDNCDGSTLVHRAFIVAMEAAAVAAHGPFAGTRAHSFPSGSVTLDPVGTGLLDRASITNRWDIPWEYGLAHLYTSIPVMSAATCSLTVKGNGLPMTTFSLAEGLNLTTFQLDVDGPVTTLTVECSGSGFAQLDWMVLQDGEFTWPPFGDITTQTEDMSLSGNGYQAFVRTSDDQSVMFVGSDQGGLSTSEDGMSWIGSNGDEDDWGDSRRLGVWDTWSPDGEELYTINGHKDYAIAGGVFHSFDRGITYTKVGDNDADGTPDMDLSSSKHFDDCGNAFTKSMVTGHLLVHEAENDIVYAGANGPLLSLERPGNRGVWAIDRATDYTWQAYANDAPTGDGLPGWTCAADVAGTGQCTGIVSALATGTVEADGTAAPVLLVGYRANNYTDATDRTSLYVCHVVSAPDEQGVCIPVETEIDVRDIEPVPGTTNQFLVVDGGVRYDDLGADGCVQEEASVYYLDIEEIKTPGGAGSNVIQIFDTDDTTITSPDWDPDYYGGGGIDVAHCNWANPGATGNLVPPRNYLIAIPGIAVDEHVGQVVAFFNSTGENRDYDCARLFRADIASLYANSAAWEPIQDVTMTEDATTNRAERAAHVDLGGVWFNNEPYPESAMFGALDGTIVYDGGSTQAGDLLLVAAGPFWVLGADPAANGWDSDVSTDLDLIRIQAAEDEGAGMVQSTCSTTAATCTDCGVDGEDVIGFTAGDQGGGDAYTREAGETRPVADHLCQITGSGEGSTDVDFWSESGNWQRWQLQSTDVIPADGSSSYPLGSAGRILLFSEGTTTQTTSQCFQGFYPYTSFKVLNGEDWFMTCLDQDITNGIPECGGVGGVIALDAATGPGIGQMQDVEAFDENRAIIAAYPTCNSVDGSGTCLSAGGAGLFLAEYDPATTDITWTEVGFTLASPQCDLTETIHSAKIDIDEAGYAQTGILRVFLDGGTMDCPILSADIDLADPANPVWAEWDPDEAGRCENNPDDDNPYWSLDIALSADGQTLLVSGGRAGPGALADDGSGNGGMCAIHTGGIDADPEVEAAISANYEVAIPASELTQSTQALAAHPIIDDLWAFSVTAIADCALCAKPNGLYLLQHRYDGPVNGWKWGFRRVADAATGLEGPALLNVAWGSPDDWPSNDRLFAAGDCTGLREVSLQW